MNLEQDKINFLIEVYNEVGRDTNKTVIMSDIAKKIGIKDENHIQAIVKSLEDKGWLEVFQQFGVPRSDSITPYGIEKVESLLSMDSKSKKPIGFIHD